MAPNSVAPESFLSRYYTALCYTAPTMGRVHPCVMSLMLAAAPREYSYWANFTFKNLWFRNVNLCHISQPEK